MPKYRAELSVGRAWVYLRRRPQISMPKRRLHEVDRGASVEGVAGVSVTQDKAPPVILEGLRHMIAFSLSMV